MKPHAFTFSILNWHVCSRCGLIFLKNDATRKAANKPCPGREDDSKV